MTAHWPKGHSPEAAEYLVPSTLENSKRLAHKFWHVGPSATFLSRSRTDLLRHSQHTARLARAVQCVDADVAYDKVPHSIPPYEQKMLQRHDELVFSLHWRGGAPRRRAISACIVF